MSAVDMTDALELLDRCRAIVASLDGISPDEQTPNNKERMRLNAERSRNLLFAAHLADVARVEITNQYHRFKGESAPSVSPV